MPTHFQRSENDIYPYTPTTSPQTLARFLWNHPIAPSTGNLPAPTSAPSPTAVTLSPTPASAKADRGSDSVRVQGVHMLQRKTVGKASALGKRISRSETVRLVPLRLSTSGSVSYDATYTHSAPVRLPLLP